MRDLQCLHSLQQGCTNPGRQVVRETKFCTVTAKRWRAVAQLFEALRYKPESRGFVFRDGVIGVFL